MRPTPKLQLTAAVFDQRGAGFHPVARVGIQRPVYATELCPVDVAANNAVIAACSSVAHGGVLELVDIA
jgi:hypothetical protein